MDLTEAEGIRELVEAESHQQWLAARQLASGRLKAEIETLRDQLLAALAVLEAQIDFPDEGDTGHLNLKAAVDAAAAVSHTVKKLLSTFDSGRVASRGLAVALFGAPNSGKSTLLNTLLGHERAIVSDIPGTTRDWIEEKCLLDGRLVRLVDMAGVRDTVDPIEAIGVGKARELAAEADLTVALIAADAPPGSLAQIRQWLAALNASTTMIVLTKADLGRPEWAGNLTSISCRTGAGLREFRQDLVARVDALVGGLDRAAPFITAARHADALKKALASLDRFGDSERRGEYTECLAFELQEAARALRAVIGEVDREDVLDRIFSTFCIGK